MQSKYQQEPVSYGVSSHEILESALHPTLTVTLPNVQDEGKDV